MTQQLNKYDFNVYVLDGEIGLYAYRQRMVAYSDLNGHTTVGLSTDTTNYTSVKFPMALQYHEEIAYLLDNEEWLDNPDGWDEHDDWVSPEYLTQGDTPDKIKSFLENLPDYELENA